MFEIKKKDKIFFENLLSWRNIIPAENVEKAYADGKQLMIDTNIEKNGPIVSCTHGIKRENERDIVDFEYMIPITENIFCTAGFYIMKEFILEDVLVCSFEGDNRDLNLYSGEILKYMNENSLVQVTPVYNVLWEESKDNDRIKVDLCFSVKSKS